MNVSYDEVFSKSWDSIKSDLALVAGLTLVFLLGIGLTSFIPAVGWMLSGPFTAGYLRALLRIRAKETLDFKDLFWGFMEVNRLIHLVLVSFLASALTIIGLICLIIPGIYLAIATMFATQVLVLQNVDSVESIKRSMAIVKGRWWWFFGLAIILGFLNLIGAAFLLVGLFITIPLSNMVLVTLVEKISPEKGFEGVAPVATQSVVSGPSILPVNPDA